MDVHSESPGHKQHDVGGEAEVYCKLEPSDAPLKLWEKKVHATLGILCRKGYLKIDQLRRAVEQLDPKIYSSWSYYAKWIVAMAQLSIEAGTLHRADIVWEGETSTQEQLFSEGAYVKVKPEDLVTKWCKPHVRVPGYIFGLVGQIDSLAGKFGDPESIGWGQPASPQPVYRVRFQQLHLWPEYSGNSEDTVDAEIFQSWLVGSSLEAWKEQAAKAENVHKHAHHHHGHSHEAVDHGDHSHEARAVVEQNAVDKEGKPDLGQQFAELVVNAYFQKGVLTPDEVRMAIERIEVMGTNNEGARIVVKAWTDPEFRARLLKDGNAAASELGIVASNSHAATFLKVVENTETVHNLVVCTLCSCYPISLLGPSPTWYKSRSYRARAVREPRKLLAEDFGTEIPPEVKIRVHDSTSDLRYLVIPMRPKETEDWPEEKLIELVSRDSMVGVAKLTVKSA